ncbi:MAG: phage holin family protein [Pirellulales bacterium]
MNGSARPEPSEYASRRGPASDLAHDLLTLAELQIRLFKIDVQQGLRAAMMPLALFVGGLILGLACLPIGLAAAALGLAYGAGMHLAAAMAVVFAAALVLVAMLVLMGRNRALHLVSMFDRSRYEWQRNVQWLKQTLKSRGRGE